MRLTCCRCGADMSEKVSDALEAEFMSRDDGSPIIGLLCYPCLEQVTGEEYA